jgi:hypothetical protein
MRSAPMDLGADEIRMSEDTTKLTFHYQKSNLFRVVYADGAWGGLTPELDVFFSFFNSRPAIPQILVQEINSDGSLGKERDDLKVSKDGIVREVEVGVVMTPQNVKSLIEFLQTRLTQVEDIREQIKSRSME